RHARYVGDQGCIIVNEPDAAIHFKPVDVVSALPDPGTMPWPMGDQTGEVDWTHIDKARVNEAIDLAFDPPEALTAAFLIVHHGQIIGERYGAGANMQMQLESWSMGKSLTATLTGRMIHQGYFALDDPAPVAAWQREGDPRAAITIRHLLQMSSGLHFTAHRDPEAGTYTEYLDHFYIYTGAVDAFAYSINRPLQFPVGTEGRYRNCDPLALGYIMRQQLQDAYWTYPQEELLDKIGIRRQVLETDPYGNFLLTGYDYGTARNWARLGLLYLNDGIWEGERLLQEGFAEFVSTPAPAWDEPVYGGLFWLNRSGEGGLPPDTYYMAGAGGQRTIIVPSLDLVIVRMGHFKGSEIGMESLDKACAMIVDAIN
ncbi:MAG: serine hydrolase, partial [Saprospiraceae bacterium]|nr:serine hydrolase [Saprospiraceae bacterium]